MSAAAEAKVLAIGGLSTPFRGVMPSLPPEQLACLREDIRANGMVKAILVDEANNILDGHHRYAICRELGIPVHIEILAGLVDDEEKRHRIIALNLNQRQLTPAERKALERKQKEAAMKMLAEGKGVREVARIIGRPHQTISDWSGRTGHSTQAVEKTKGEAVVNPKSTGDHTNATTPVKGEKPADAAPVDYANFGRAEQKAQALKWSAEGIGISDIADRLQAPRASVRDWIKHPERPVTGGRPRKVSDDAVRERWEASGSASTVARELGVSRSTVAEALKRIGVKKARDPLANITEQVQVQADTLVTCSDEIEAMASSAAPESVAEFCAQLNRLAKVARTVAVRLNKDAGKKGKQR